MRLSGTNEERFWHKVDRRGVDDCWQWLAYSDPRGYGSFGKRTGDEWTIVKAHRFAYESMVGPIPDGLTLDHLCRNPSCVNPSHLEPVTQAVNTLRGESPAAQAARRSTCVNGHLYTPETTKVYRGARYCRICNNQYMREKRASMRGLEIL